MTFSLVDVGYSLPFGQAVKLIFFAPCEWHVKLLNLQQDTDILITDKISHDG